MKIKLLVQILLSSFILSTLAAVPSEINYQGLITDSDGDPIESATNSVAVNLYQVETGGTAVYTQSFTEVASDANGIYSIQIGGASLQSVLETNSELWLELIINEEALSPRQEIHSVPYALVAKSAESFAPGSAASNAITALQNDVGQNEADADIAIAALQTENTNRVSTDTSLQADLNAEAASRTAADATLQADIDQNESDADTAIADLQAENALRSEKEPVAYVYDTNRIMSNSGDLGSGQRILLVGQTDLSQNGIYTSQGGYIENEGYSYSLVRTQDFDEASEMQAGAFVFVTSGNSSGKGYVLTQSVYIYNNDYSSVNFKRFTYDQELDAFDTSTLSSKAPVQAVRETNIALSTSYSYGADKRFYEYDHPYETGDRILFMGQDSAKENGIYEVINQSFADVYLSRSQDLNAQDEFFGGIFVFVEKGPLAGQGYILEALHDDFQLDAFSNYYGYHDINFSKFTIDTTSDISLSGNLTVTGNRADFLSAQEVIVPTPDQDNEATSKAYVDAAVAANTSALATETSARATAISDEASTSRAAEQANADDIFSNTTDISNNAVNISNNSTDITTNSTNISANTGNVTTNTTNITLNATAITSEVTRAEAAEQTNVSAIATLQSNVDQNEADLNVWQNMAVKAPVKKVFDWHQSNLSSIGWWDAEIGDRALLSSQSPSSQNGIYAVHSKSGNYVSLTRASDFDSANEVYAGAFVFDGSSSGSAGQGYVLTNFGPNFQLGTDTIIFRRFTALANQYGEIDIDGALIADELRVGYDVVFDGYTNSINSNYGTTFGGSGGVDFDANVEFNSTVTAQAPTQDNEVANKAYVDSVVVPTGGLIAWPSANVIPDGWSNAMLSSPMNNYIWIRKD